MRLYIQLGDVQLGYVAAQVGILLLQKRLGARWFIPWAPWQSMMNCDNLSRLDTSWMGSVVVCSIVIFSYCRVVFV